MIKPPPRKRCVADLYATCPHCCDAVIKLYVSLVQVIKPPPRKRCVADLYARLDYLLKELEPWEGKLLQATKKAKLKLRKEQDDYVEEPEPKPVSGDFETSMHRVLINPFNAEGTFVQSTRTQRSLKTI